jgi:hypothetical protein
MNVAIIEKGHFEVTYTLISLFDNGRNHITIFVEGESYQQLQLMLPGKKSYSWVVKKNNETNRGFITSIFRILNKHPFDLVYFDTIDDNFIVYAYYLNRLKNKKIVLTLHDINGFFDYQPSFSIRRLLRYIGKKQLLKSISHFNVLSAKLMATLRSGLDSSKKIYAIPGSFFDETSFKPVPFFRGDTVSIVIPGSIDTRRRNYELIFPLLKLARQRNVNISLTLLGGFKKGYSERIKQNCQIYRQTNNNLHVYSTEIVDQPEFDKVMRDSHFIWTPLQPFTTISDGVKEQYGTSTCSGNIADIIRYAKPFFIPNDVPLDTPLEKSCIAYVQISDITDVLEQLTPDKYVFMQEHAYQASLHYTKENIISRNPDVFT